MSIIFNSIDEDCEIESSKSDTLDYLMSLPKVPLTLDESEVLCKFIKPVLTFDKLKAHLENLWESRTGSD